MAKVPKHIRNLIKEPSMADNTARFQALEALGYLGESSSHALTLVRDSLLNEEEDTTIRQAAFKALVNISTDYETISFIIDNIDYFQDMRSSFHKWLVKEMIEICGEVMDCSDIILRFLGRFLKRAVDNENIELIILCLVAICRKKCPNLSQCIDIIRELTSNADHRIVRWSNVALFNMSDQPQCRVKGLTDLLKSSNADARHSGVMGLADIAYGGDDVGRILKGLLGDEFLCISAAAALIRMGKIDGTVENIVVDFISAGGGSRSSVIAIGELGKKGKKAIKKLKQVYVHLYAQTRNSKYYSIKYGSLMRVYEEAIGKINNSR